jgi:hypothetical protein
LTGEGEVGGGEEGLVKQIFMHGVLFGGAEGVIGLLLIHLL